MSAEFEPTIGDKYGRTTVISGPYSNNGRRWTCRCECGAEVEKSITAIRTARDTGNGACRACSSRETHGYGSSKNSTYSKYQAMKQRCQNPKHKSYANYGAAGVTVCREWSDSFAAFLRDMGECPGPGYTLDRIENHIGYMPGNVRWATRQVQAENTRRTTKVNIGGHSFPTIASASHYFGIPYATVRVRISTYGWTLERALLEPIDASKRGGRT